MNPAMKISNQTKYGQTKDRQRGNHAMINNLAFMHFDYH
jgi:hypothetical protein